MRGFVSTTHPLLPRIAAIVALAALALVSPRAARAQGSESFAATHLATLDGDQETPAVTNAGSGIAVMRFDPATKTLAYRISVALPTADVITAAHFHAGGKGVSGPPIHDITFEAGSRTATGTWENMSDQEVAALSIGGLYVNVHTTSHQDGQIRGQVTPIPNLGRSCRSERHPRHLPAAPPRKRPKLHGDGREPRYRTNVTPAAPSEQPVVHRP